MKKVDCDLSLFKLEILAIVILLIFAVTANSQIKVHGAGNMRLHIEAPGWWSWEWAQPPHTMVWPNGWDRRNNLVYYSVDIVTDQNVILNESGSVGEFGVWPGNTQEFNNVPLSIRKVVRYEPPSVTVDDVLLTPFFEDEVDPTLPSDEMIEIDYVMNSEPGQGYPGMVVNQKSYSYVNPNHDDYVIFEVNYKYTQQSGLDPEQFIPDNPISGWLAIFYGFQICEFGARIVGNHGYFGGFDSADEISTHAVVPSQYSSSRNNLIISYARDGDSPDISGDDTGDPNPNTGEFLSHQYTGFTFLHVDNDVNDESDDSSNPRSAGVNAMDFLWNDDANWAVETFSAEQRTPNDDEEMMALPVNWQGTKKYTFNKDDDVKIVYALGAGGITIEEAKAAGAQYHAGQMSDTEKNELIATGFDSLVQNLDRAAWAFERDLVVPAPPPSPDLEVTSGPDQIILEWSDVSDVADPITGVNDFAGYRVYRARGQRDTTYVMLHEGNETSYVDDDVTRGVAYYYYVTAFDDGSQNTDGLFPGQSLESSRFLNRTANSAVAFKPGVSTSDEVLVVPNPYDLGGRAINFPGEPNKILFVNLPPICTIRIYTVAGKLIKVIEHTSGSGDEAWDLVTAFNQFVASGIYVYRIDDAQTFDGEKIPSSSGKFVIIR